MSSPLTPGRRRRGVSSAPHAPTSSAAAPTPDSRRNARRGCTGTGIRENLRATAANGTRCTAVSALLARPLLSVCVTANERNAPMRRTRRVLVTTATASLVVCSGASAADIDGIWTFGEGQVSVIAEPDGRYTGTVVTRDELLPVRASGRPADVGRAGGAARRPVLRHATSGSPTPPRAIPTGRRARPRSACWPSRTAGRSCACASRAPTAPTPSPRSPPTAARPAPWPSRPSPTATACRARTRASSGRSPPRSSGTS